MVYVWRLFAFIAVTGGAYRIHPLLGAWVVLTLLALWLWLKLLTYNARPSEVRTHGRW